MCDRVVGTVKPLLLSTLRASPCTARNTIRSKLPPHQQQLRQQHIAAGDLKDMLPTTEDLGLKAGQRVTMALSGGVDSSVSLKILSEMPVQLDAVFMRNWDPLLSESPESQEPEPGSRLSLNYSQSQAGPSRLRGQHQCQWERDYEDARAVARYVGLKDSDLQLKDFSKEYWSRVFEPAVNVWERGGTPNPDIACNREIKFGELFNAVPNEGGQHYIATGHYARVKRGEHSAKLYRAKDMTKDQTYYLSQLTEAQLKRAVFPLAYLKKSQVRALAKHWNLPTAEREESMGVCFIGERGKFGDFISQYTSPPSSTGYLVAPDGSRLSRHDGLWHYTIGQGARISGLPEKWFVAKKGIGETGQDILVVPGSNHPSLQCKRIYTEDFHWIHGGPPDSWGRGEPHWAQVQVRHRMEPVSALVQARPQGGGLIVDFPEAITGVSPGQVIGLWDRDWCLGSGTIRETRCMDELRRAADHRYEKEAQPDTSLAAIG